MVQSIELTLDDAVEARIRLAWRALADAGLPSLADHQGLSNRPHITVAVAARGLDNAAELAGAVVRGWDLGGRGLAATIGAPILFGGHRGRWVLARQVVASRPLLTLHAAIQRAIAVAEPAEQSSEAGPIDGTGAAPPGALPTDAAPNDLAPSRAVPIGAVPIGHMAPDAWTPHVSLVRRIPAGRLAEALGVLDVEPLHCRIVGARLWDSLTKSITILR